MASAILGLLSAILPLAIKIIMAYLERKEVDNEVRRRFMKFVESLETSMKSPAKLRQSYKKQGDRLDEMMREIDKEQ